MIQTLKLTHSETSRVFFTSDSHWGHTKLVEQRGFKSIKEHDEILISNWNKVVRPQDFTIHLGDFVLGCGDKSEEVCRELFRKLNGFVIFLWGNHRSGVRQIYKRHVKETYDLDLEVYPTTWNDKVKFVGESVLLHVKTPDLEKQNHFVFCSHFAHRIWIDGNKGVLAVNGHSHGSDPESNPDFSNSKRLDVGVDNFNFTPLEFGEFLRIMEKKQHTVLDHHDRNTNPSF